MGIVRFAVNFTGMYIMVKPCGERINTGEQAGIRFVKKIKPVRKPDRYLVEKLPSK